MSMRTYRAAFVMTALLAAAPLHAAVLSVSNATQLIAAFGRARGGDTISLAPGQYDSITIRNLAYTSRVKIVSASPTRPAILSNFTLRGSQNVSFANVELANIPPAKAAFAASVFDSRNISFSNVAIHGLKTGDLAAQGSGLRITGSNNVTLTDSTVSHLGSGMFIERSTGVTIDRNRFTTLRRDGLNVAGAQALRLTNNSFSDFHPQPGDHPDAMQFWADPVMTTRNVLVRNNLVLNEPGGQVQGVFMNTTGVQSGAKFQSISIMNNLMYGTMWNGIAMFGAEDMNITRNTIFALNDSPSRNSWIRLVDVDKANVSGNSASLYMLDVDALTSTYNLSNVLTKEAALALVALWQVKNRVGALLPGVSTLAADAMSSARSMNAVTGVGTLDAVPEPAVWLQLVLGFAAAGLGLRARRVARISRPA